MATGRPGTTERGDQDESPGRLPARTDRRPCGSVGPGGLRGRRRTLLAPLGAGGWFVRLNGCIWEAMHALWEHRRPLDLYHTALVVRVPEGRYVVEDCWPIADANEAVASPQLLANEPVVARRLLDLVGALPSPVWDRDELGTGEMWNSNSVIAWLLARSGLPTDAIRPPPGGRAPGWQAGLAVAHARRWLRPIRGPTRQRDRMRTPRLSEPEARLLQPPELEGPGCMPGPSSCR